MHWFVHGGAGVLMANLLPEHPALALGASCLLHYPLDWLPHKDPGIATCTTRWQSRETQEFLTVSLPDMAATAFLGWCVPTMVAAMPFWTTLGCVVASVAPDIIDGLAKISNLTVLQWHRRFHDWIHYDHYTRPVPSFLNLIIQLGLSALTAALTASVIINGGNRVAGP